MGRISRLDYLSCTNAELDQFIRRRQLGFSTEQFQTWDTTDKALYLKAADGASRFRFLDLAPEMRNLIYLELLKMQQCGHKGRCNYCSSSYCYPQILSTCKQIYKEAIGIFLYDNNWELRMFPDLCNMGVEVATFGGLRILRQDTSTAWWSPRQEYSMFGFPKTLLRIRCLTVTVTDRLAYQCGSLLAAFASVMSRGHSLQELKVKIRFGSVPPEYFIQRLYPLTCLREISKVSAKIEMDKGEWQNLQVTREWRSSIAGYEASLQGLLTQDYATLSPTCMVRQRQRHENLVFTAARYGNWLRQSLQEADNEQVFMWLNAISDVWLPRWRRFWNHIDFTEACEDQITETTDGIEEMLKVFRASSTFKKLTQRAFEEALIDAEDDLNESVHFERDAD